MEKLKSKINKLDSFSTYMKYVNVKKMSLWLMVIFNKMKIFSQFWNIFISPLLFTFVSFFGERILSRLWTLSLFIKLIQKLIVFGKLKDNIIYSFACLKFESFWIRNKEYLCPTGKFKFYINFKKTNCSLNIYCRICIYWQK